MFTSDGFDLIDQAIGQFWKRLASVAAAKGERIEQHFDQCFRYCRHVKEIFSMCMAYTL